MKRSSASKKSRKGSVIKRHKSRKSSSSAAAGWGDNFSVPKGVYANNQSHYFRRPLEDALVFCSGANAVTALGPTGSAVPWLALANLTADVGSGVVSQFGMAIQVSLSSLPSYAAFTTLYNRFRIEKLEIAIEYCNGDSNTNIGCQIPRISIAPDYTDATVPASQAALDEYETVQSVNLSAQTTFNTSCVPKPSQTMYGGGMTAGYGSAGSVNKVWLDSDSSTGVPHYAFKLWVRNFYTANASAGNSFRLSPVLYFACREPR